MNTALSFFLAFLVSGIGTKLIILMKHRFPWILRNPTQDRWHTRATPSMGGIAIFIGFTVASLLFGTFSSIWKPILLGAALVFLWRVVVDDHLFGE